MAAIAEKETSKAARVEKDKEDLKQSMLEAHQEKDGKEKETAKEADEKEPVIATEAAAEGDRGAKGQEEKENPNQEFQKKEEERKQALQSEAAKVTKNKEEEEKKKRGMADKPQSSLNLYSSPRHPPTKRSSFSPASASSAVTQGERQKLKICRPPSINKIGSRP